MGQEVRKTFVGCSSRLSVASAEAAGAGGYIFKMASSLTGLELRFSWAFSLQDALGVVAILTWQMRAPRGHNGSCLSSKGWVQDWHNVTSIIFYWSKQSGVLAQSV